jgi:hypothetical protein
VRTIDAEWWADEVTSPPPPDPIHISDPLKRVGLELLYRLLESELDPQVLHELAWLKAQNSRRMTARQGLSEQGIEKLADILINRGSVPTVGFWRKYAA